jgi:hypothetical protein
MSKERSQMRIVAFVIDNETGIDGDQVVGNQDFLRLGMAAGARRVLEERDRMVLVQKPCGRQSGNTGADHCDAPSLRHARDDRVHAAAPVMVA